MADPIFSSPFATPSFLSRREPYSEFAILLSAIDEHALILITDGSGNITYGNPGFCECCGYKLEDLVGRNPRMLKTGSRPADYFQTMWRTLRAGNNWSGEFHNRARDGTTFRLESLLIPFVDKKENIHKIIACSRLVEKQGPAPELSAAGASPASPTRELEALLELFPGALWLKDTNNRILKLNQRAAEAMGRKIAEVEGKSVAELTPREAARSHVEDLEIIKTGRPKPSRVETTETFGGELRYTQVDKAPYWNAAGEVAGIVVMTQDITARKQTERALTTHQDGFQEVMEHIREVYWIYDLGNQQFAYLSPGFEAIWGRTCVEIYKQPGAWLQSVHPEDRAHLAQRMAELPATEKEQTYRILRPDGTVRWIRDRSFPSRAKDGNGIRLAGVAEDITESVELQQQFLRSQRMETIGTLAGGIAHDLNNVLTPVLLIASLIQEKATDPRDTELLVTMERSVRRGMGLIRQILLYSRGVEGRRGKLQLRLLIAEVADVARQTFPRSIKVMENPGDDLPLVWADATQIHQVLLNLCVNARDAMPGGGVLVIEAHSFEVDTAFTAFVPEAEPGRYLQLVVRDTGSGIPAEIIDRIFDPFFTTKAPEKGTGLGLSTVMGIIKSYHGFIRVNSEPGRGTSFEVHLPAAQDLPADPEPAPPAGLIGSGEFVLIVDDERVIRETLGVLLTRLGFESIAAADGAEALIQLGQYNDEIKLVITDINMPVMDGVALSRILRRMTPDLPIIAMTGLQDEDRLGQLRELGGIHQLAKPFGMATLTEAVRAAMAQTERAWAGVA